jgi:hypothetical protein
MRYKTALTLGRILLTVAFLSLIGAWLNQLFNFSPFGMTQQHMFNDSMALSLLGIGMLIDAAFHKGERK